MKEAGLLEAKVLGTGRNVSDNEVVPLAAPRLPPT
jgi:hypothetical protein